MNNFIKQFESSVLKHWNSPALDDYGKSSLTYGQLAYNIECLRRCWHEAGLNEGDRVAINARSSSNWIEILFAAITGGYTSVQLYNVFTPVDTMQLVNHSESRILYTEKKAFEKMDFTAMPSLIAAIDANTMELLACRGSKVAECFTNAGSVMDRAYPNGFSTADVMYPERETNEVCAIMYTSGSTGSPKGVMLTVGNFSANVTVIPSRIPFNEGENYLSMLPFAHSFGMTVDAIIPLCCGMHTHVLGLPPIPSNLIPALSTLRPQIFFGVPLIFLKLIETIIGNDINSEEGRAKLVDCEHNKEFTAKLRDKVLSGLGGNIKVFATGGAAIPSEIENLLAVKLSLPFITGYGMTECAPIISFGEIGNYKLKSCGKYVENMKLKIDSSDPTTIPGEILVKGPEVFAGYYKNEEATKAVFTQDGWFRTGDMAIIDDEKNIFISGRCKNMLLSANGQNIFPEEIEVVLNEMPLVAESLVVQRGNKLTAIIVLNEEGQQQDSDSVSQTMSSNLQRLNDRMPTYSRVSDWEVRTDPFCKTPKGSIRRFMYN